jgi:hypothetical protein
MIEFISTHWVELLAIAGSILATSTAIAKLTPTQKDDNFVAKVQKFFNVIADLGLPDIKAKK